MSGLEEVKYLAIRIGARYFSPMRFGSFSFLFSLSLLGGCGASSDTKPSDEMKPAEAPSSGSLKIAGMWATQSLSCNGEAVRSPSEQYLLIDKESTVGIRAVRYVVDEADEQHICRTLRAYQPAQIVPESAPSDFVRGSSGTYWLYLRAIRHVCQTIRDGKLDEKPYKDETESSVPEESFHVDLKLSESGDEMELTSSEHPQCQGQSLVLSYAKKK